MGMEAVQYLSSSARTNARRRNVAWSSQAIESITLRVHLAAHHMTKRRSGWLPSIDPSTNQEWAGAPHHLSAQPTGKLWGHKSGS